MTTGRCIGCGSPLQHAPGIGDYCANKACGRCDDQLPEGAPRPRIVTQEQQLADWLVQQMPAGTIIGDPIWWANRIVRQLQRQGVSIV